VTTGTISALSGLRNDRRNIQISAPVQPGNSGGPLLGEDGSIVGVVVEKIDAIKVARATGDIPQNVNFAISLGTLQSFLNANGVAYALSDGKGTKSPAEIAAEASRYTVLIECLRSSASTEDSAPPCRNGAATCKPWERESTRGTPLQKDDVVTGDGFVIPGSR
jgi:hypothetical protein